MKNVYKLSSLLLVVLLVFQISCSDDDTPAPVDDLVGKWALSSATFIATNDAPTDLLEITNFPTVGGLITLQVPTDNSITELTVGAIADGVCTDVANYATLYIELTADGKLFLNCAAEMNSEESGSWIRTEDPTLGTVITLNVSAGGTTVPISYSNFVMAANKAQFSGRTQGFPMVKDFPTDLGPTNIQFLTADMEFTRVP